MESPPPPAAGSGLHSWLLDFTRTQLLSGLSEDQVFDQTFELARHCGRAPNHLRKEIEAAITGAVRWIDDHPDHHESYRRMEEHITTVEMGWASYALEADELRSKRPLPRARWQAPINSRLVLRIIGGPEPAWSRPPVGADWLRDLYGNYDFNLCIACSVYLPQCRSTEFWDQQSLKIRESWQWMVPNPCLDCGDGGWVKSDNNAGERIWLIIEFDQGSLGDQGKLLAYLGETFEDWELAMVVYSGGKSLHGWFSCVGMSERGEIMPFFREASALGADLAMSSSVQYTRAPWGMNTKTGKRQEIVHWDPAAIERHNRKLDEEQAW